jgi:hypothetical protein
MLEKSESIKNLAIALHKAQEELGRVNFDATNPFLKNQYATLGAIIETSKPILVKNGLSVSQPVTSNDGFIGVTTILMHDTGEYIASTATISVEDQKGLSLAQVAGSIITYLRRYSLAAILNLYADEDTDANKMTEAREHQKEELFVASKPSAPMSLASAMATKNSEGIAYGSLDNSKLQLMANSLKKAIDKNAEPDKLEERRCKLDAILVILKSRADENPA